MRTTNADYDVRKFIRSRATRQFLTAAGAWTTDATLAAVFPDIETARTAALEHHIPDAELYYQFGQQPSPYDFALLVF